MLLHTKTKRKSVNDSGITRQVRVVLAYVQMDAEWDKEDDATDMMDKYFEWLKEIKKLAWITTHTYITMKGRENYG